MDPNLVTLTPPPYEPAPSGGTGSGDEKTHWSLPLDPSPLTATSVPGAEPTTFQAAPHFHRNQLVAGRYQILEFIARGGMGEVYEALDLDLSEHLALKVLSRELSQSDEALQRFKRELSLARKVTHPNVCRTYDFFQYLAEDGTRVACLSMELLRGETLSHRILREGRIDSDQVRTLAQQMTAALDAAHTVGVVHRDFKPSNIMLVKGSSGEASLRVVVTDFGLAFSPESQEQGGNRFLGTPAYMSPEQVEYHPLTTRSDIYSLGLVIYEMLTGKVAFQGSNAISAATRRLKEGPPPPRNFVPDLDPFWDVVLAKCLARKPQDRFATAAELLEVLDPAPLLEHLPQRRPARTLAFVAATGLLFSGGSYATWNVAKGRAPWALPVRTRPSIAVLGFRNLGPQEVAWRGTALAEMLGTELGLDEKVRLIPGEEVARMKVELGLNDDGPLDSTTSKLIGARLGADLIVAGSYVNTSAEGAFRVDLKLMETRTGETKGVLRQEGSDQDILAVVHGAGISLRNRLGLSNDSPEQREGLAAAYPKDSEGMRWYAQGIERLRAFDPKAAIPHFERALSRDASCALIHSGLSEAYTLLGYDDKAKAESLSAMKCSAGLNREDRLRVEARANYSLRQWDQAAEAYRTLFGFFPDNLDYGLGYATSLVAGAHPVEAERAFDQLLKMGDPKKTDPRVLMERAEAARAVGDITLAIQWARKALAGARASRMDLLAARAQARLGAFTGMNGRLDEGQGELLEAEATFRRVGDLRGLTGVLHARTMVDRLNGDFRDLDRVAREMGKLAESFGHLRMVGVSGYMLGMAQEAVGDYREALRTFEAAQRSLDAAGERQGVLIPMMETALVQEREGRLEAARRQIDLCLDRIDQVKNGRQKAFALAIRGRIYLATGQLDAASKDGEAGLELGKHHALGEEQSVNLELLARVALWRGDLPEAGRRLDAAKAVLSLNRYEPGRAEIQLAVALRLLEEGDAAGALKASEAAHALNASLGLRDGVALARVLMSQARLALGQREAARQELEAARDRVDRTGNLALRVEFNLQAARLAADAGRSSEVRRHLDAGEALAQKTGHLPYRSACRTLRVRLGNAQPGASARLDRELEGMHLGQLRRLLRHLPSGQGAAKLPG